MLTLDIQRNGSNLSVELPMPIGILASQLHAFGVAEPLNNLRRVNLMLRPTNEIGEHFMKIVQPDDTLWLIAHACCEADSLEGEARQAFEDVLLADRFHDVDQVLGYLRHGPAALDRYVRVTLGDHEIDLPAPAEELREGLRAAGLSWRPDNVSLRELDLLPLNGQGMRLLMELSPYESLATANLACAMLTVPEITASMREVAESARRLLPPQPTQSLTFYCPLSLQVKDEDGEDLVEADPAVLVYYEDEISEALRDAVPKGQNMAQYLRNQALKDKVASMQWDVAKIWGTLYGAIHCELRAPLSVDEKAELVEWISGQNSDGLGEGFEQHPVETTDGDLYVSLWHSGDDYFVYDQTQFEQYLNGGGQETSPEQITLYCPLKVQMYEDECEDLVDVGDYLPARYECEIRAALQEEVPEGENMADYLEDNLKEKITSVVWDVEKINDILYGKITCDLCAPLTPAEQQQLIDECTGQASDGLGEGFEQRPIKIDDGELYVSLWQYSDDYYMLPEADFKAQVLEQSLDNQGFGGMGGMA